MLKLIMAVSSDGVLSLGPSDDMSWTSKEDKQIFKLLTLTSGAVLGAGLTTYNLLPHLPNREVIPLSRSLHYSVNNEGKKVLSPSRPVGPRVHYDGHNEKVAYIKAQTLHEFKYNYPNAWLIGGFKVAYKALTSGLVDEVYMCENPIELLPLAYREYPHFQIDYITRFLEGMEKWKKVDKIQIGRSTINVWKLK